MNNQQKIKLFDAMKRLASSKRANDGFNPFKNNIYYSEGIYYATDSIILVYVDLCENIVSSDSYIVKSYLNNMMNFNPELKRTDKSLKSLKDIIKSNKETLFKSNKYDPKVIKRALNFYSLTNTNPEFINYEKMLGLKAQAENAYINTIIMPVRS